MDLPGAPSLKETPVPICTVFRGGTSPCTRVQKRSCSNNSRTLEDPPALSAGQLLEASPVLIRQILLQHGLLKDVTRIAKSRGTDPRPFCWVRFGVTVLWFWVPLWRPQQGPKITYLEFVFNYLDPEFIDGGLHFGVSFDVFRGYCLAKTLN